MLIARIQNATRVLGKPTGWDDNTMHCAGLPVLDTEIEGLPVMVSAWTPTPGELARLNAGASVHLMVIGRSHPPVSLSVPELNSNLYGTRDGKALP